VLVEAAAVAAAFVAAGVELAASAAGNSPP